MSTAERRILRAIVADDEPPARRRLLALLGEIDDIEVVAECGSGSETVAAVRAMRPDILFLDVQMPEGDGFDVLEALGGGAERVPAVIFVTAYDAFALRAFDVHAVDYLLKPFDRERFAIAVQRARARLPGTPESVAPDLAALFAMVRSGVGAEEGRVAAGRIAVRTGGRIRFIPIGEIDYITAEANYVRLHVGQKNYLVRETMQRMAERLDPRVFLRIHRSTIVQLDRVHEIEPLFQGEYVLLLRSGARLTSARSYRSALREALGLED